MRHVAPAWRPGALLFPQVALLFASARTRSAETTTTPRNDHGSALPSAHAELFRARFGGGFIDPKEWPKSRNGSNLRCVRAIATLASDAAAERLANSVCGRKFPETRPHFRGPEQQLSPNL